MAINFKNKHTADLLAGIIVLIVAAGLVLAVIFAIQSFPAANPQTQVRPSETTTDISTNNPHGTKPPTRPTGPTLAPNPIPENAFTYDANGYLTCLTDESWLGVDVSEHQGQIQWEQVAQTDVEFAMVRLAYRGWGAEGVIRADARGLENLDGAANAGLQTGVYFFSQAISVEEAIEEARFLLELLDGRELDLPVVFDWETVSSEDARTANMKIATLNACAHAFCKEIEDAGYEAMVYFNLDMSRRKYLLLPLQEAGYDFWLALYSDNLGFSYKVRMWQYTSSGSVPGIKGRVDLNLYFPE